MNNVDAGRFDSQAMTIMPTKALDVTNGNCTAGSYPLPVPVQAYDYWCQHSISYYPYPVTEDKGQKAYGIAKALIKAKLVKLDTAMSFMQLMDTLLAAL